MPNPFGTEGPKQPVVDIIALAEACHGHLVEELNNNHNHMMKAVENHHKNVINGLKHVPVITSNRRNYANSLLCRLLQKPLATGSQRPKASVHTSTQTGDTKATTMTTRSQASSSKTTQATATTASVTSTQASQATTESDSQGPTSPHDSHLSQHEHTDSSPTIT